MQLFETDRLIIRNWKETDREIFHLLNSEEQVMKFFPFRRDRKQSDELMDFLTEHINENGFGYTALELKSTGECIGFTGLMEVNLPEIFPNELIEIAWRLAPQFWRKGYASEAAIKWLEYGFETLNLDEIVSFAVHSNQTSFNVMERIGMGRDQSKDFDHIKVPDTHPHLKRHLFYAMSHQQWLAKTN